VPAPAGGATLEDVRASGLALAIVFALSGTASADVRVGGAVGAGGQGGAAYSAVELSVDATVHDVRVGLAARGVWLDGEFRDDEWSGARGLRVIRLVEAHGEVGDAQLAVAGGGLAPAQLGHVADGYRATLDDRPRTGVRTALASAKLSIGAELDDVIEPELAGGAASWQRGNWIASTATAIDLDANQGAVELALARRWSGGPAGERDGGWRVDVGSGLVGERDAAAAVGFANVAFDHRVRWTIDGEVRAGTGTVGGAFGPLHRIERAALYARSHRGVGAAAAIGVVGASMWARAGIRARPDLGPLATVTVGLPADRRVQLAGWIAASRELVLGAGELRVAWAKHCASALEVGRMVSDEPMATAAWSATAWFAIY
jgi:hypothetical protein